MNRSRRAADPYRDLDVVDSRAPRFNQAVVGLLSLLAVVTGWWLLLGCDWMVAVVGFLVGVGGVRNGDGLRILSGFARRAGT